MEKRILSRSRVRKVDFELSTNILVLHKTYGILISNVFLGDDIEFVAGSLVIYTNKTT